VLQKVIEIPTRPSQKLKVLATPEQQTKIKTVLIRRIPQFKDEIRRLKNKLKKEYFTEEETIAVKKLIREYKLELQATLEVLGVKNVVFLVPATKKQLKELKRENPQINKKHTQQNIQQNIQ
jgi:hypothetical protein